MITLLVLPHTRYNRKIKPIGRVTARQLNSADWQNEVSLPNKSLYLLGKSATILSQTHLGEYVGPTIYFRPLDGDQINAYVDFDLIRGHIWADKKYLGIASHDSQNPGTWIIENYNVSETYDDAFFAGLVLALEKQHHLSKTLYANWKARE